MLLKSIRDKFLSPAGISMKMPAFIFILLLFSLSTKAGDLYWIGGSGNWGDINHWSLSSGNAGGSLSQSIPQAGDNVFFDAQSGFTSNNKTVTINQESSCRNLAVKGISTVLVFEGMALNIFGSADYQTGTILNNIIYFKAGNPSTVNFNNEVISKAAIYFYGPGSWLIKGKLNSTGGLYFLQGSLNFGSSNITARFFDEGGCCGTVPSPSIEPRTLHLGSSVITLTERNPQSRHQSPSWAYTGTTLITALSEIYIAKGADDGYGVSFVGKNGHKYNKVSFTSTANPPDPSAYSWYQIAEGNCSFNNLNFASCGFITSNCIIDTLNLATSQKYYLFGSQQINVVQNPTSECEPLWSLGGYGGIAATIKSSLPLSLRNVRLNYLKSAGTELHSVTNGIDGGQNTGWVFTTTPRNLFWIGGGGNWNDPAHWSMNADGTVSGGCAPTRNDNVFFNRFSGLISSESPVVISTTEAECNSISWNGVLGNPVFKTAKSTDLLNIFGSSIWQNGMQYEIASTHYLSSQTENRLTSNGVDIKGDTYFLSNGEWILNDVFSSIENDLFFKNGKLNTNSQAVTIRNFGSVNEGLGARRLLLGNSTITINGNWSYITYGGPAITLDAGTSTINLTAKAPYFYYNSGLAYNNLVFTDPGGSARLQSTLYSLTIPATFKNLTFEGNAFLNAGGNPTPLDIVTLNITNAKKYLFGTNMEVKVTQLKSSGSLCAGLLEIASYLPGTRSSLNLVNPTNLSNAKATDINASGSTLTVTGGVDGGNNKNIIVSPATSQSFFWIGGAGNWSDPSHWTLNADGTSNIENGCLPTSTDNVFFNRYSGGDYTVTLDIPANCNNMTWDEVTGSAPTLKGLEANPLNINGSLVLQTGMDYNVERTNFIGSTTANTITTHGTVLGYRANNRSNKGVFFNNPKGKWMLSDVFNVKNFGVINGIFDTNSQTVNAENYHAERVGEEMNSTLLLGSSTINVAGYWDGGNISTLNSGKSTINMGGTLPVTNSSGGGVNNYEFYSKPGLVYNDLNFTNINGIGKIAGNEASKGNSFNKVSFAGESSINGPNQFATLTLGTNKDCHLMAGSVQTVDQLISNSSCGLWNLDNNNSTVKAIIKSNNNITLSQVKLTGITVSGGASYNAYGSDMGNNSGWTFSSPSAQNLYWIGGSGDWHDLNHWTVNADGTPSGGCLPTRFDNVFFTVHSGESPVIGITGDAEFHNMTWNAVRGKPAISGTLNCYGSLKLQSSLSHFGGINFLSSEESSITTGGAIIGSNFDLNFSGNGSYIFFDDFTSNSRINFRKGTLNFNGKTVKALSFTGTEENSSQAEPISLILGASKIYLSAAGEGWLYTGTNLNAGTSQIYLTGFANYFKGKDGAVYHDITFDANENPNNRLYGSITVDKLTFSSKNSTYQLEAGKTVTVEAQLQMSGNNCSTVQLRSTMIGEPANISIKAGSTTYNFITVRDINASGLPLTFLPQSSDGGNNTNLQFLPNIGTGIGIIGPDIVTCTANLPLTLDGSAMMPNENTKIQWSNLTTGELLGTNIKQTVSAAGTYQIKTVYATDCEVTDEIVVSIDPVINMSDHVKISQPTCSVEKGNISLEPLQGILYSVDGGDYSNSPYYELSSGQHYVTAKNTNGCVSDTTVITINAQPQLPVATISYGKYEFKATGKVEVIQSGQSGGIYTAFPYGLAIDSLTGTIDLGNSIPAKSYTVSYSFTNGECSGSTTISIQIIASPATISYPVRDYCAVGTANVIQTGSVKGKYSANPASLKIDELTGSISLSESKAGFYTITYTYPDGSAQSNVSTTLTLNDLPNATITSDSGTEIPLGQTVNLTASGGVSYAWIGPYIQSGQNTETIKVSPKGTATYTVIATNAFGCSDSFDFVITVKKDHELIPSNVITPNGDGKNDTWIIKNIERFPDNTVRIYDRAGRLIYLKNAYFNDWDGTLNGKLLNEDTYIYVIDLGNGLAVIKGTLSIIRDQQ
jgi:gliding motility-associated-like protein